MSRDTDMHTEHSKPIPINTRRARAHSVSESSSSEESCSPSSPVSPLQSPLSGTQPRIAPISPGATPILSYFLNQSPKTPSSATFPFRRGFGSSVFDDDSETDVVSSPVTTTGHARRATTAWTGAERFAQPQQPPVVPIPDHTERAVGLLRRLSLGGTALRPQVPPIKTSTGLAAPVERVSGVRTPPNTPAVDRTPRRSRRSQTMAAGTPRPKRAPSPMGERILTGHFDGFN